MPYPMLHLKIAYQLLEKYDWIEKKGDFLLGSVSPDAVHFHEPYDVKRKEISHVWNCGPVWGVTLEHEKWKGNIDHFFKMHERDERRDFIAGYYVHLLCDWMNDERMWGPFRMKIIQGEDYDRVYSDSEYRREAYGFDRWLYQNDPRTPQIWELLGQGQVYGLDGYILAQDLARQKQSLLTEQYADSRKYDIGEYVFYSRKVIDAFIEECVELAGREISKRIQS